MDGPFMGVVSLMVSKSCSQNSHHQRQFHRDSLSRSFLSVSLSLFFKPPYVWCSDAVTRLQIGSRLRGTRLLRKRKSSLTRIAKTVIFFSHYRFTKWANFGEFFLSTIFRYFFDALYGSEFVFVPRNSMVKNRLLGVRNSREAFFTIRRKNEIFRQTRISSRFFFIFIEKEASNFIPETLRRRGRGWYTLNRYLRLLVARAFALEQGKSEGRAWVYDQRSRQESPSLIKNHSIAESSVFLEFA